MVLEVLSALSDFLDGSYRLCRLYFIVLAGLYCWIVLYQLDWIVSYRIVFGWIRKHWILRIGWLLPGWDGWTGWGVGGMGVGQTDVSRRRNGRSTMGAGTGAPLLALEGVAMRCLVTAWVGWMVHMGRMD